MKRIMILVICALLLILSASAEEAVPAAGLPNPIVEVETDDAFFDTLGIRFDSAYLPAELSRSIIAGTVGQAAFVLENIEGDEVEWTLRFTKDMSLKDSAEMFAGIYDENMSEPIETEVEVAEGETVTFTELEAMTEGITIIFFTRGDVCFSLTANGVFSRMQYAEIMDSIILATAQ